MDKLLKTIESIEPLDVESMKIEINRIDNLSKPIGSLGELENIVVKLTGIRKKRIKTLTKKNIIIMCSDNGVVSSGVSSNPQSVTAIVTKNFERGITGVNALAQYQNSEITVVDIGVNADFNSEFICNKKIRYGTDNIMYGPAMTKSETVKAINVGIQIVDDLVKNGYEILGTGEMGVGNTATSAAVFSVISNIDLDLIVGKGAGLTNEQLENKKKVIQTSIEVNKPDENDIIDILSKVGGLDIAGLCGCFLSAAKNRVPIVIDGLISSVAALCAYKLNPLVKEYMFASHLSNEPGAKYVMETLGLKPMINLGMRLGEGSGCPLAFGIIEAALYTMNNMGTFEEAALDKNDYVDIRI